MIYLTLIFVLLLVSTQYEKVLGKNYKPFKTKSKLTEKLALNIIAKNNIFLYHHKDAMKHNASVLVSTASGVFDYLLNNKCGNPYLLPIYNHQTAILEAARKINVEDEPEVKYMYVSSEWTWVANFSRNKVLDTTTLKPLNLSFLEILQTSEENALYRGCVDEIYDNGPSPTPRYCNLRQKCVDEIRKSPSNRFGIPVALRNRFLNFLEIMNCTNLFPDQNEVLRLRHEQVKYMYREVLTFWEKDNLPDAYRYHIFRKVGLSGISGYTELFKFLPHLIDVQNPDGSVGFAYDSGDVMDALTAQSATTMSHYYKYCLMYGCKVWKWGY